MRESITGAHMLTSQDVIQWPNIANVVYLHDEKRWESMPHFHSLAMEFLYVIRGCVVAEIGGAKYTAEAGDLVIYQRGVKHKEVFKSGEHGQESISLRVVDCKIRSREDGQLLPPGVPAVLCTDMWQPEIELCFRTIYWECVHQENGFSQIVNNHLQMLILIVMRLINEGTTQTHHTTDSLSQRARQYIEHNFKKSLLVRDIAQTLSVSHSHLTHAFTQEIGVSPQQYLSMQRILEAKRLLVMSGMPVHEIADSVGYASISRLNAQFRQLTGLTPKQYRMEHRSIPDHVELEEE